MTATAGRRVPIYFSRWFVPLARLTAMPPRKCYVGLAPDGLVVSMGWAFRARLPRRLVATVLPAKRGLWAGIGVHGWRRTWVVNGSLHRLIEIRLREPVRARAVGVPVRVDRLFVSVEDPAAVLTWWSAPAPDDVEPLEDGRRG